MSAIPVSAFSRARILRALLLLLFPFWYACAGSLSTRSDVDSTVGRATFHDIMSEVPETFGRFGYTIAQTRVTGSTMYIETGWRSRAPFDDEAEHGVDFARTRLVARARKTGPSLFILRIIAENQVRGLSYPAGGPGQWSTLPATDMYKAYVSEITTEIRLKVDAGLRTHGIRPVPGPR